VVELEDMIAAAIEKALAKQQTAAIEMAQKAIHLDRTGVGSHTSQAAESTLESDPIAHLTRKARTIKSDAEWTPEEQAYISQIFHAVMVEGMPYSD
jgi:hypothetical protein